MTRMCVPRRLFRGDPGSLFLLPESRFLIDYYSTFIDTEG